MFKYKFPLKILWIRALLCIISVLSLVSCSPMSDNRGLEENREIRKLEKLCKVWGYTKYRHSAFLLGQRDWDEELLALIPIISAAKENEINHILHEWFVGLGKIDYQSNRIKDLEEDEIIVQADTSWISDENYLGKELSMDLQQLVRIPAISRNSAPVDFLTDQGVLLPDFSNEKAYIDMDYEDRGSRLLGIFRLWNAMEYNYPYLDILDENWHKLLPKFIAAMLAGTDKHSYELTIAAMGAKLQDAHVYFEDGYFLLEEFGEYGASVELTEAEGKMIVWKVYNPDCSLQEGDVICSIEGKEVEEVIKYRQKYIATTMNDKVLNTMAAFLIRSHNEEFEVVVQRGGMELSLMVKGDKTFFPTRATASESYEILDGNIGLINPAALKQNEFFSIMEDLMHTEGLIIDLRQYPSANITTSLAAYVVDDLQTFAVCGIPSQTIPGAFFKSNREAGYLESWGTQHYNKSVVVLIDEKTQSLAEYMTMAVKNGRNVTIIGENSVGSNGFLASIPLPGDMRMMFSSQSIYTPEMGQVQRIGISPDIEIHPTIKGILEGRDEIMEAAVDFIQTKK